MKWAPTRGDEVPYSYFVVEGPHDNSVIQKILEIQGFTRAKNINDLDEFLNRLVPRAFPPNGDLLMRVPVPSFMRKGERWAVIASAGGYTEVSHRLALTKSVLGQDFQKFDAVGLIVDADTEAITSRFQFLADAFADCELTVPPAPGIVALGPPRTGGFVLPDNVDVPGSLETTLMDCGAAVYPNLIKAATDFVDAVSPGLPEFVHDKMTPRTKPMGREKAIIGAAGSYMRPGKSVQVSIEDNQWVSSSTLNLPRVQALNTFITRLI